MTTSNNFRLDADSVEDIRTECDKINRNPRRAAWYREHRSGPGAPTSTIGGEHLEHNHPGPRPLVHSPAGRGGSRALRPW